MAYLYLLWAVEDDLVKIGITQGLSRRLRSHTANSSNPLRFSHWKIYRLETIDDARSLETHSLRSLRGSGYAYRDKRELFRCSPSVAAELVDRTADKLGISILKNYPGDFETLSNMGLDFIDLPHFLFDALSLSEREAYLQGASAVLHILGALEGVNLTTRELGMIVSPTHQPNRVWREMWRDILDSVGVVVGAGTRLKLVNDARDRIEQAQEEAFNRWQEIEEHEEEQAA